MEFRPYMDDPVTMTAQGLSVPNDPIVPFIDGDGTVPKHSVTIARVAIE